MEKIYFARTNPNGVIPTKREEDVGYDIYACFESEFMCIEPHSTKLIPTGIASAISSDYGLIVKERGSTGANGIAVRCGVIDSGYRDEIFIALTNTTNKVLYIVKGINTFCADQHTMFYPYSKAIAQLLLIPVPKTQVEEISYEELKSIPSIRQTGKLGSSGK